jgi:L-amino acid N-acyltransferase YncA
MTRLASAAVLVREATALDAEAIARVRVLSWQRAYRGIIDDSVLDAMSVEADRERWLRRLGPGGGPGFTRVVADERGRVLGFAAAGPVRERVASQPARLGELYLLYLAPAAQRCGLGTRLARSAARGLDALGLPAMVVWVLERNAPARGFYERLGGREAGRRDTSVGMQRLTEVMYAWDALAPLLRDEVRPTLPDGSPPNTESP